MKEYDIIIVGGGIVGLTLAALLSPNLHIALLDTQSLELKPRQEKYALRVSAINLASQAIFAKTSAWELMQNQRISPFQGMQVWDTSGNGEINFNCFELAQAQLGYIIENNVMQTALLQTIKDRQIEIIAPIQPQQLVIEDEAVELKLEDGQKLRANLIVGADGANSWVRECAQIEFKTQPYHHTALVTALTTAKPHKKIARQVFLPDGILALLPLAPPHQCSIVWSTDFERASKLNQCSEADFNAAIQAAFGDSLGAIKKIDHSLIFNLTMRHAKNYVQSRVALIGDAIHTIHPLAGQGLNLGLADAACLAEIINQTITKQRDLGHLSTLRKYERARKGPNLLMLNLMAGFKNLFSAQNDSLIYARNLGLNLANQSTLLKRFFMHSAAG